MIRKISKKDYTSFITYCEQYGEEIGNRQLLDKIFRNSLKKGDTIYVAEEDSKFLGMVFTKKSNERRFLQILCKDAKVVNNLLQTICWNQQVDLWIQVEKDIIYSSVLRKFKFFKPVSSDIDNLLCRKFIKKEILNGYSHNG